MFRATTALRKLQALTERIWVVQGGTSAGKTIAILLLLINEAQSRKVDIDVTSETMPHMKMGARKDFLNIMHEHHYYDPARWNRTDSIYTFETGATMHFYGTDSPDKVRGPRRDILFINECNNISFATFDQMEVRTKERIILDYNPVSEFWVHEEVIPKRAHDFVRLTYRDNEALDPRVIESIESKRDRENWWRVYGEGEVGINEGQVYDGWHMIEDVPKEAELTRRWLDFGFTNDPTAIGDLYRWNNGFVLDEQLYRTGMQNNPIADFILTLAPILTIADSAEPKSIAEIKARGVKIAPAVKGADSVKWGIDVVQDQTIYVTKRSLNIIKEYRNYLWKTDRDGNSLNVPEDLFNHHMDGIRYAITDVVQPRRKARVFANKPGAF